MKSNFFHSILFLSLFWFPVCVLSGCKSTKATAIEPLVEINNHTKSGQRDSNTKDSVIITIYNNDTTRIENHHYHETTISNNDTLYIEKPVPGPEIEVIKEVIPEWCWWSLGINFIFVLILFGKIAFWIYRKFVLKL